MGFSGGSDGKESACSAGDPGSMPGSEGSLEKGMATKGQGQRGPDTGCHHEGRGEVRDHVYISML